MDPQIRQLADSLGILTSTVTGGLTPAVEAMLQGLLQVNNANQAAANSTLKNVNAKTIENDLLTKRLEREKALENLFGTLYSGVSRSVNGLGTFTAQLYRSADAFEAAKISLDTFGDIFKMVTKVLSETMSIFPFFRNAGNVLKNIADSGVEIAINALKNRIEQAKVITDVFQNVGKTGATFGAGLNNLIEVAGRAGINIQEFGKFVSSSAQNLVGYGTSISQSSQSVANLTLRFKEIDPALVVLKGSFGALAESAAEYFALQRQIGINEVKDSRESALRVREYIRLQNELTEITGRTVAEQRRAEEQRRQVAAYQMAASKLEGEQRNNLMAVMTLFDQMGPDMASAMQEFFSNNGQLINAQNIIFATMNREMFDMGVAMMQTIRQPTEQFKKSMADNASAYAPIIRAQQAQLDQAGFLQLGASKAGGDVIAMMSRTVAAMTPFLNNLENLPKIIGDLSNEATKGQLGITPTLAKAIEEQNKMKIALDKTVVGNLSTLDETFKAVNKLQTRLISLDSGINKVITAIINDQPNLLDTIKKFTDSMAEGIQNIFGADSAGITYRPTTGPRGQASLGPEAIAQLTNPEKVARAALLESRIEEIRNYIGRELNAKNSTTDQSVKEIFETNIRNYEQRISQMKAEIERLKGLQEGGIATERTVVGENNQPEAVIPLARGNIPLDINFEPMLRIMEQQREYLEEMASTNNRNIDYLERIYHAVS